MSLMKVLNSTGPNMDPTCYSILHWAIGHYPLDVIIQPIPYPVKSPHIKSVFFLSITHSNLICTTEVKVRG